MFIQFIDCLSSENFVIPYLNYKLIHVPIFLLFFNNLIFNKRNFFKSETNLIFFLY